MSSTGKCFGIGNTIRSALVHFEKTGAPYCEEIAEIAAGSFKPKNPPQILGSGYVVKSLEAALWAFYGYEAIPRGWKAKITHRDLIESYADRLHRLAYP